MLILLILLWDLRSDQVSFQPEEYKTRNQLQEENWKIKKKIWD